MSTQCLPLQMRLWLIVVTVMAIGCTALAPVVLAQQPVMRQPVSPLVTYNYATLAQNNWRVLEIVMRDKVAEFSTLGPIYINFDPMGTVGLNAINCNAAAYQMVAGQTVGHYQLVSGPTTTQSCGAVGNREYHQLRAAMSATTAYEIRGDQLILAGTATRIVAVIDNAPLPTPAAPTPSAPTPLVTTQPQARLLNPWQLWAAARPPDHALTAKVASHLSADRWRLTAATEQTGAVDLDELAETYFIFQGMGYLHLHIAPVCGAVDLSLTLLDEEHYQIIHPGYQPDLACSDPVNDALARLVALVANTTEYALHNEQIVLRGACCGYTVGSGD